MVEVLHSVLRNSDFSGELEILIRQSTEAWETVSLWSRPIRTVWTGDWGVATEGIKAMWKVWSGNKSMWGSPSGEAFRTETPKPQPWCEWESGDQESLLGTQDTRIRGGFRGSCPQRSGTLGYSQQDPRGQWELPGRELLPVSPWERACEPCGSRTKCRGR